MPAKPSPKGKLAPKKKKTIKASVKAPPKVKATEPPPPPEKDKRKLGKGCVGSLHELAEACGVDRETIRRHMKMSGNPGRKPNHSYDVALWKVWFEENGSVRVDSPEKRDLECRRLEEVIRRMQLDNAEREGQLVDLDEASTVLGGILKELQMEIRQARHRLAPEVVGLSVGEANIRIGKDLEDCLARVAIPDHLKKKPFWRNVSATLSALLKK